MSSTLHQCLVQFTMVPSFQGKVPTFNFSETGNFRGVPKHYIIATDHCASRTPALQPTAVSTIPSHLRWPAYFPLLLHTWLPLSLALEQIHSQTRLFQKPPSHTKERKAPMQLIGQDWWKGLLRMECLKRQLFAVKVTKDWIALTSLPTERKNACSKQEGPAIPGASELIGSANSKNVVGWSIEKKDHRRG